VRSARLEAVIDGEIAKVMSVGSRRGFEKLSNIIRSDFYSEPDDRRIRPTFSAQAGGSVWGIMPKPYSDRPKVCGGQERAVQETAKKYFRLTIKTVGRLVPEEGAK